MLINPVSLKISEHELRVAVEVLGREKERLGKIVLRANTNMWKNSKSAAHRRAFAEAESEWNRVVNAFYTMTDALVSYENRKVNHG